MRNIYLVFISLLLFSCESFVEETPKGNLIPETVDDLGMILDAFDPYDDNAITYSHANSILMSDDSRLPDIVASGVSSAGQNAYVWADHLYEPTSDDRDWNGFYHVIYLCNYILENIDNAPEGDGVYGRNFVKGNALVNRANSYFVLVNLYGKHYDSNTSSTDLGVPMPLESDINLTYARSTVKEVYDQVRQDLEEAAELLSNTADYTFQGTKPAALGLLARLHLYQGNYKKAWEYAEQVRTLMPELMDYNTIGQETPGQPDFGITNWPPFSGWEKPDVIFFKWESDFSSQYYVSDELLALMDQTVDLRFINFFTDYKYNSFDQDPNGYRCSDIADFNRGISLGEVVLTEAEAKLRDNDVNGALLALNAVREKRYVAGTPELTETNPDALLQLILDERRRETLFKGLRWFDLKRLNKDPKTAKTITRTLFGESYTLEPGSKRYVLPIPRKVIELNSLIEQNPR